MNFIKQNKLLTIISIVVLGVSAFWYIEYAEDKSICEDNIRFSGSSQDGWYYNDWLDSWKGISNRTRYESYDMAMNACLKHLRR